MTGNFERWLCLPIRISRLFHEAHPHYLLYFIEPRLMPVPAEHHFVVVDNKINVLWSDGAHKSTGERDRKVPKGCLCCRIWLTQNQHYSSIRMEQKKESSTRLNIRIVSQLKSALSHAKKMAWSFDMCYNKRWRIVVKFEDVEVLGKNCKTCVVFNNT